MVYLALRTPRVERASSPTRQRRGARALVQRFRHSRQLDPGAGRVDFLLALVKEPISGLDDGLGRRWRRLGDALRPASASAAAAGLGRHGGTLPAILKRWRVSLMKSSSKLLVGVRRELGLIRDLPKGSITS